MRKNTHPAFWSLLPVVVLFSACAGHPLARFSLQSAAPLPAGTPLEIALPEGMDCCGGMSLRARRSKSTRALQGGQGRKAIFVLEADLPANTGRQYEIRQAPARDPVTTMQVQQTDTGLEIVAGGRQVLTYNTATLMPPPGLPDYYRRSGFIHPLYSPSGQVLTDGFPVGHTHQHGIFFAWVNTTYRGEFTDFWNQQNVTGTVAFRQLTSTGSGPVAAQFQAEHEHLSLRHGPVLTETWTVTAYRLPKYHLIDLTSRQRIIGNDTLFINKYHYGGMAARLAAAWNEADSSRFAHPMQILTSQGITHRDSANHTRPHWTAAYGPVDGRTAGLAIFDHPSNFRFPQPVRVHPSMPYFVLTPMVEATFALVPGRDYIATYRLVAFDGEPDAAELEAMWQAYAAEVQVEWKR